jgi:mono/diheme cytochrome c family protein
VWLFVLLAVLGYWGMRFLDAHAGGFNARVYGPYRSIGYVEAMLPKSEGDVMFANGQRLFGTSCLVCHQSTGQGVPGQFPPLAGSEWVQAETPNRMIRLVLDGIQGPITVKGQAFNATMPPWRDLLTDEEIAAVLTYVRGNQNWGNTSSPVTPEQVKAVREKTASRANLAWTPEELLAVPLLE